MNVINIRSIKLNVAISLGIALLVVSGCGGGISGTGDGIIVVTPDNSSDAGTAPDSASQGGDLSNTAAIPFDLNSPDLFNPLLQSTAVINTQFAETTDVTVTSVLQDRITFYKNTVAEISADTMALESALADNFQQCPDSGPCDVITTSINTGETQFNSVSLTRGLSGYFDDQLSYTKPNGDNISIKWSVNHNMVSVFADTSLSTTYSLIEKQPDRITFRQINKAANTLTQATLVADQPETTSIEADLVDWYVRVSSAVDQTVLYANAADNGMRRREAIINGDESIFSESCSIPDCVWQPDNALTTDSFNSTETTVGDFTQTYLNTPEDFVFEPPPERFAVSNTALTINGNPLLDSLVCGGTFVQSMQRTFCWVPIPLESIESQLFAESITDGIITYQPLSAR